MSSSGNRWGYAHITSSECLDYIRSGHYTTAKEAASSLGVSVDTIHRLRHNNGLTVDIRYTEAEKAFLRANFGAMNNIELAEALKRSKDSVRHQMKELGLVRTAKQVAAIKKRNKGCFKPGNVPHNTREVGSVVKHLDGYWYIKTEKGLELYHRHLWEREVGPLTDEDVVVFVKKPQDWKKLKPSDLKVVDRNTLVRMNENRQKAAKNIHKTCLKRMRDNTATLSDILRNIENLKAHIEQHERLIADYEADKKRFPGFIETNDVKEARHGLPRLNDSLDKLRLEYFKRYPTKTIINLPKPRTLWQSSL